MNALYSAFEELLEMVDYILDFQKMREEPKKIQYPVMDLCEYGHVAQFKYGNAHNWVKELLLKSIPYPGDPLR